MVDAADTDLGARVRGQLADLAGRTAVAARWLPRTATEAAPVRSPEVRELALRADDAFPAASLAKLPIAVELIRRVDLGAFALDERISLDGEPRAGGGSVLDGLDPSWQPTLADLCALMLSVSDNTAANVVLDLVGMGEVNYTMERLNLHHTRLARHFMDLAARQAGHDNQTSAAEMVSLLALLDGNALPHAARVRAMLVSDPRVDAVTYGLPAWARVAHKTGTLEDTLHDAGLMTGPAGTCVYCVLTTEQPDLPLAALAVARTLRLFWDAWCAGAEPQS